MIRYSLNGKVFIQNLNHYFKDRLKKYLKIIYITKLKTFIFKIIYSLFMKFTERLRLEADPIWRKIFVHPFVIELYDGTLPFEKFKFYTVQDFHHLLETFRCISLISAKSEYEDAKLAMKIAEMEMISEMKNYEELLNELNLGINDVKMSEVAHIAFAYDNFLIRTCALGSSIEGFTALLPCFWSYIEIADYNRKRLLKNKNKIYRKWAEEYLKDEYRSIVESMRKAVDDACCEDYKKLRNLFIIASKYEYMFWTMAYNMDGGWFE